MKYNSFPTHNVVHIYFQSNYYTDFYTYAVIILGIYRRRENEKVINGNWTYVLMLAGCSNGNFEKQWMKERPR